MPQWNSLAGLTLRARIPAQIISQSNHTTVPPAFSYYHLVANAPSPPRWPETLWNCWGSTRQTEDGEYLDITESREKDFSQCSMRAGEAMTVIHSSGNSHSSNEPQAFAYNFPVTQPSPLSKNPPAMHSLNHLRGRTVTPKLHMDNVPHHYGSGPVRSVFLLFSGPRQPQLPTRERQTTFLSKETQH